MVDVYHCWFIGAFLIHRKKICLNILHQNVFALYSNHLISCKQVLCNVFHDYITDRFWHICMEAYCCWGRGSDFLLLNLCAIPATIFKKNHIQFQVLLNQRKSTILFIPDDTKPLRQRGAATLKGQVLPYTYRLPLKITREKEPIVVRWSLVVNIFMFATKLMGGICTVLVGACCNYMVPVSIPSIDSSRSLNLRFNRCFFGFQRK